MQRLTIRCAVLVAVALLVSSCPPVVQILTGVWVFDFPSTVDSKVGVVLLSDGSTEDPNPLPNGVNLTFTPLPTWEQTGRTFVMVQNLGSGVLITFTATVTSDSTMEGVQTTISNTLPFTAERVE